MKVGFRLIGTGEGRQDATYFTLESEGGKTVDQQREVFVHFNSHCNILGLAISLQGGSGMITLQANDDQLRPDVVGDIHHHAQNALDQIK